MSAHTSAIAPRYTDEALAINARNVGFDWTGVPLEYIPGEPYATHFWNVMHLVLPEGERAMADVFAQALPFIEDERLREEVKGFVGQEATHARSHESFRQHLIEGGVDIGSIIATMEYLMNQVFDDHGLTGYAGRAWLRERLGLYAAAEHFTAVVGEWLIQNENFEAAGMDPTMLDLLRWHGAEEMEHRNVAFDAYQYVDGSYARRVRTALIASAGLTVLWLSTSSKLYKADPARKGGPWPLQMLRGTRRGLLPGLGFFFAQMPQYLRPNFHPSQMGDISAAVRYLAQSPAARAAG